MMYEGGKAAWNVGVLQLRTGLLVLAEKRGGVLKLSLSLARRRDCIRRDQFRILAVSADSRALSSAGPEFSAVLHRALTNWESDKYNTGTRAHRQTFQPRVEVEDRVAYHDLIWENGVSRRINVGRAPESAWVSLAWRWTEDHDLSCVCARSAREWES